LSEETDSFQNKLVLQAAQKNCLRYRESLLGELLEKGSEHWRELNFWRSQEQEQIVENFIGKVVEGGITTDHAETAAALLKSERVVAE
jgi:hypothetical protein